MEQSCSSLVLLWLSWVEQLLPAQLLRCASGLSCLVSDASLACQVQWCCGCFQAEVVVEWVIRRNGSRVCTWKWSGSDRIAFPLQHKRDLGNNRPVSRLRIDITWFIPSIQPAVQARVVCSVPNPINSRPILVLYCYITSSSSERSWRGHHSPVKPHTLAFPTRFCSQKKNHPKLCEASSEVETDTG